MNLFGKPKEKAQKKVQALAGRGFNRKKADKGQTRTATWTEELPHPVNMGKYATINDKPEVRKALDLLTNLVAPNFYVQMAEQDEAGKKIDPEHPNKQTIINWCKTAKFLTKYKEIVRTKIGKGFCPVERKTDGSVKILPPETIWKHQNKKGKLLKWVQKINGSPVAEWQADDPNFVVFIHHEDTSHPYGYAFADAIVGLIEARDQLNIDMPKIIHRFSSPTMVAWSSGDITAIKQAIEDKDVDEAVYIGNVNKDEFGLIFDEPDPRVKFTEYIEQMNFQIAEELGAPLILLLKNATEASATKMLESVDRYVQSEQAENSDIVETRFFDPLVDDPVPEFMHGAPKTVLDEMTLEQIAQLKGNGTITWNQAQDLIRQKGIPLIEDEEPKPLPILQSQNGKDDGGGKPLLNRDKVNQLEMSLQVLKENFDVGKILISEALKEGDRVIGVYVGKARVEAEHRVKEATGRELAPETLQHFELVRASLFAEFRDSLLLPVTH